MVAVLAPGCDDDAEDTGSSDTVDPCEKEDRAEEYMQGIEKTGDALTVTLVKSVPAPPEKGDNEWTVQVADDGGAPMDGLGIEAVPWMPDHGHGTSIESEMMPGEAAGEYVVDPVNLLMAGYWEITLAITDAEGNDVDEVMFKFCVRE